MTQVSISRYVDCPFSASVELAEKVAARHRELFVTPSAPLGERVHFAATTTDDTTDTARKHDALLIAWRPTAYGLFPDFHGVLTVRPEHRGVLLRLDGEYTPPFGAAGKIFDAIAGRTISRRTMQHFLADLASDIQSEYALEVAANKTA